MCSLYLIACLLYNSQFQEPARATREGLKQSFLLAISSKAVYT